MSIFPKLYPKCPNCGCNETLIQAAMNEAKLEHKISQDITIEQIDKKELTALKPRTGVIGLLIIPVLIEHYDTCLECGRRRLTRAELGSMTVTSTPSGGI